MLKRYVHNAIQHISEGRPELALRYLEIIQSELTRMSNPVIQYLYVSRIRPPRWEGYQMYGIEAGVDQYWEEIGKELIERVSEDYELDEEERLKWVKAAEKAVDCLHGHVHPELYDPLISREEWNEMVAEPPYAWFVVLEARA